LADVWLTGLIQGHVVQTVSANHRVLGLCGLYCILPARDILMQQLDGIGCTHQVSGFLLAGAAGQHEQRHKQQSNEREPSGVPRPHGRLPPRTATTVIVGETDRFFNEGRAIF